MAQSRKSRKWFHREIPRPFTPEAAPARRRIALLAPPLFPGFAARGRVPGVPEIAVLPPSLRVTRGWETGLLPYPGRISRRPVPGPSFFTLVDFISLVSSSIKVPEMGDSSAVPGIGEFSTVPDITASMETP